MPNLIINTNKYDISSTLCNLTKIVENKSLFNIPIYQRLYVWTEDQIKTLLEDLNRGFKDQIQHYYLGGVMLSKNHDNKYDLIDGQQRFTTLWLIGSVLKNEMLTFNYIKENNLKIPRVSFSIRDYANDFFMNPEDFDNMPKYASNNLSELEPIESAIQTIKRFFIDYKFDVASKNDFANYLLNNVFLMVTIIPKYTDENKLFEVLNNRGMQLQHHDILKAKMLKHIKNNDEKSKYAQLWEACSIMDEYIEKNIKDIAGLEWKDLTFQPDDTERQVELPCNILDRIASKQESNKVNLLDLCKTDKACDINDSGKKNNVLEYDSGKIESIISFPMLLLHVLRIFQFDKNASLLNEGIAAVDEKNLLTIFEESFDVYLASQDAEENVKLYFQLLLSIRIKFDKHIIKWIIKDNNLKIHGIKKLYLNKEALQRKESEKNDGFALLQSMLYHSQQIVTHYWLTPLLNKLRSCDNSDELYKHLIQLDNAMFCSGSTEELSPRSWHLLNSNPSEIIPNVQYLKINQNEGTGYPSYVFYKLDFVLWYLRDYIFESKSLKETLKENWENYRMTAKNSVEHISPQQRKESDTNTVWDENDSKDVKRKKLDDFGNLVLLTSNMNSEYSNNIYTTKRSEFLAKAKNKRLDSLKSALIFENHNWNWNLCEQHRDEMIKYFNKYFKNAL